MEASSSAGTRPDDSPRVVPPRASSRIDRRGMPFLCWQVLLLALTGSFIASCLPAALGDAPAETPFVVFQALALGLYTAFKHVDLLVEFNTTVYRTPRFAPNGTPPVQRSEGTIIVRHYLKTWFLVDLLTLYPLRAGRLVVRLLTLDDTTTATAATVGAGARATTTEAAVTTGAAHESEHAGDPRAVWWIAIGLACLAALKYAPRVLRAPNHEAAVLVADEADEAGLKSQAVGAAVAPAGLLPPMATVSCATTINDDDDLPIAKVIVVPGYDHGHYG